MSDVIASIEKARAEFSTFLSGRGGWDVAEYGNGAFEAGVFANNEPAWHNLGIVVPDPTLTAAQVLELVPELASEVDRRPLYFKDARTGEYRELPNHGVTVRQLDEKPFAPVGRQYRVFQNRDAFDGMDAILDEGAQIVTAGTLKGGALVWMLAKLPGGLNVAGLPSEEIDCYLLCSNSHDGSSAIDYAISPLRVVCRNSLRFALDRTPLRWKVRHTSSAKGRVIEARKALGISFRYIEEFGRAVEPLVEAKWDEAEFDLFLRSLVPDAPKDAEGVTRDRAQNNVAEIRGEIIGLARRSPNLEAIRGTAWAAVNAVAEWNDHYRTFRGSADSSAAESRFRNVLLAEDGITQRAWRLARERVGVEA